MDLCSYSRERKTCSTICRELSNLLPVGKDLVKEDSGSDSGVAHASDSDRTTKFRRGQNRPSQGHYNQNTKGFLILLGLQKSIGVKGETTQISMSIKSFNRENTFPASVANCSLKVL